MSSFSYNNEISFLHEEMYILIQFNQTELSNNTTLFIEVQCKTVYFENDFVIFIEAIHRSYTRI